MFRRTCAKFATGITVVTTSTPDGRPHGLTVNSFTSVSCDPPLVSVCIDLRCSVLPALSSATHFGINVLSDRQRDMSVRFAEVCDARFDGIEWHRGASGVPLLGGVLASFECRVHSALELGDHILMIGHVEAVDVYAGSPLLYFNSQYCRVCE